MKACSFLPAATQMIYDMGLQHLLYGVTFECMGAALAEKPALVRCIMEGKNYTSKEIDAVFSAAKAQGKSPHRKDGTRYRPCKRDRSFYVISICSPSLRLLHS